MAQTRTTERTTGDATYSMRVVTRLTGLAADTIRAWERRYGAVAPARTGGNTRRYSAEDVRRLTLLREATARGHRISDVARLGEEALLALATSEGTLSAGMDEDEASPGGSLAHAAAGPEGTFAWLRRAYLEAISRFEARRAAEILARAAVVFAPRDFVLELVLPILVETGDRWERGELSIAQEHLVSQQVRSLLDTTLRLSSPHPGAPRLVAATPEGQLHEFGALAGAMLAGLRGHDVLYLGPQVPAADLLAAQEATGAAVILLSVVYRGSEHAVAELAAEVDAVASRAETWIGVAPDHPVVPLLKHGRLLHRFEDLDIGLATLQA
jgi:DNA-binding transcriptional MerR regulator/methylmalonyl-CoA mutase cobalamin-binding subunit